MRCEKQAAWKEDGATGRAQTNEGDSRCGEWCAEELGWRLFDMGWSQRERLIESEGVDE